VVFCVLWVIFKNYFKIEVTTIAMKILLFTTLLFSTLLYCNAQTGNCNNTWTTPRMLSNNPCEAGVPNIVSHGDTIHAMWISRFNTECIKENRGLFYSHSFDGGQTFSTPVRVVDADSEFNQIGTLVASGDHVYIMFTGRFTVAWGLSIVRSTDTGNTWGPKQDLGGFDPKGIAARDSNVYIYFSYDDSTRSMYSGLIVSHDYGITWDTTAMGLPRHPWGAGTPHDLTVTAYGLHIVYDIWPNPGEFGDYEVGYMQSTDFGYHWSQPETISVNDGVLSYHAQVHSDDKGNVFIVWQDGKYGGDYAGTVILRRSTDNGITWLNEEIMSDLGMAYSPQIGLNDSLVTINWDKELDTMGAIQTRISEDLGRSWCPMQQIGDDTDNVGSSSNDNNGYSMHLIWAGRKLRHYKLFYASSILKPDNVPVESILPQECVLYPTYPNPFNGSAKIRYKISSTAPVVLEVFNVLGKKITTLVNEIKTPGEYTTIWQAENFSSGIYFCRMIAGRYSSMQKIMLVR